MTDERLQEIRERLESVAPWSAPWVYRAWQESGDRVSVITSRNLTLLHLDENDLDLTQDGHVGEFVAHARRDVPDLLAEVERLRREVSLLQGIVSDQQAESGLYDAGWNAGLEAARLTVSGVAADTGFYHRLLSRISELRRP